MFNLFVYCITHQADEQTRDKIEQALTAPNRMDAARGVPYGWDEDDELAGFEALIAQGGR